ncbi:MAG: neutral/alkaline non-lysosomal ceramidase N-terminal domain-containing protein [Actinomycetota bacterium]
MRSLRAVAGTLTLFLMLTPGVRFASADTVLKAGVGSADATWHVGTGSGQYADKSPNAFGVVTGDEVDPHNHGMSQEHSYGVQSRLTYRALVVEGSNGKRVALVKSDSYLAQDHLVRRAAQILAKGSSGISYDQILLHASHNHSSPYYTSPSWGVWLFQDMFDIRAFEYHARAMASSIEQAVANLRPARMGATTIRHTIYKGNIAGATITDDGTPGGYPDSHGDFNVTVLRFDDVSNPQVPTPLAAWVNHGQHPESNDSYALISADFLGPLERFVERDLGAPLIFSQGDVGSAEGPYDRSNNDVLPDGVIRAWAHVGHAQTERGARYLADSIVKAWRDIGDGNATVPFSSDFPVDYIDGWVPGPLSHPYPSVSNCRTETTVEGNPGAPVVGLPDCERAQNADPNSMVWENLRAHGLPVPDHYDAPGFTGVEENMRLRLQAVRIGEVLLGSCACEAQVDLILNFESRADNVVGNIFDGYDWGSSCEQNEDTTWTCSHPQIGTTTVSDARYRRMQAQVHNNAAGWDKPENAVAANAEPDDPAKIWGNFTKEELSPNLGYALPVGVGHGGDYNGYTVSYREYMSRDHYRKALTAYGPHTADYMATRLVRMAAALKGGPALAPEPHDAMAQADEARQVALSTALGVASSAAYDAWLAALPNDLGPAEPLVQPTDVARFSAATFTWRGGSNAVDNPRARVERLSGSVWKPYADQSGEVQTMVEFPKGAAGVADTYAGNQQWRWTANFEAFDAFPRTVHPDGQTPNGTYRFVVDGAIRLAGVNTPYHFESNAFHIGPWEGISVQDVRVEDDGSVSFAVAVAYPRTYASPFRFVHDDGRTKICYTCSFRPWASTAAVARAEITVARAGGGGTDVVAATLSGGRWIAQTNLQTGDTAAIARGGVIDAYGEINGAAIAVN